MIFNTMLTSVISISLLSVPVAHTAPSVPTSNDLMTPCPLARAANIDFSDVGDQTDHAIVPNYYVPYSTEGIFSNISDESDHPVTTTHHIVPLIDDDTPLFFSMNLSFLQGNDVQNVQKIKS